MKHSLTSRDFSSVLSHSKAYTINSVLFRFTRNSSPAVGFIIKKTIGNAVERNMFKRQCRLLFVQSKQNIKLIIKPLEHVSKLNKLDVRFAELNKRISCD